MLSPNFNNTIVHYARTCARRYTAQLLIVIDPLPEREGGKTRLPGEKSTVGRDHLDLPPLGNISSFFNTPTPHSGSLADPCTRRPPGEHHGGRAHRAQGLRGLFITISVGTLMVRTSLFFLPRRSVEFLATTVPTIIASSPRRYIYIYIYIYALC